MTPPPIPFSFIRRHCPDDLRVPERVRALEAAWGRKWTPADVWEGFLMMWVTMGEHPYFTQSWYKRHLGWTFGKDRCKEDKGEIYITTPNSRKAQRAPYLVTPWGCSCPAVDWCKHRTCYSLITQSISFGEEGEEEE